MEKGFYTNSSEVRFDCNLLLTGQKLYIYLEDGKKTLIIWDLKNPKFTWHGSVLTNSQTQEKMECGVSMADQIKQSDFNTQNTTIKKKQGIRPVHIFFITLLVLIIGTVAFLYFLVVPWVAEKTASLVPAEIEIKLGEKISQSLITGGVTNDSVNYYAKRFVGMLELESEFPIKITILKSDEINAFALPGGKIFIYTGLLEKMKSHGELVALIGHEVTHVTHRHSLKSILRGAAAGVVIGGLFGDFGSIATWVVTKADEFKQLDYSREMELDADRSGVELMVENRVDPKGMLDLLKLLQSQGEAMPGMMKYLSTHPETEERIRKVKELTANNSSYTAKPEFELRFKQLKNSLRHFK